jgi:hypothetical protein
MAWKVRSEPVLELQKRQWLLCSDYGGVLALFGCFVVIYVYQALTITRFARFLDCSGFILFLGFVLVLLIS